MSDLVKSHVPMGQTYSTPDQIPNSFTIADSSVANNMVIEGYEPTMNLRWNNGVLEQAWRAVVYINGKADRPDFEWRPVPQVEARDVEG